VHRAQTVRQDKQALLGGRDAQAREESKGVMEIQEKWALLVGQGGPVLEESKDVKERLE
jgi:hypothetical protein